MTALKGLAFAKPFFCAMRTRILKYHAGYLIAVLDADLNKNNC